MSDFQELVEGCQGTFIKDFDQKEYSSGFPPEISGMCYRSLCIAWLISLRQMKKFIAFVEGTGGKQMILNLEMAGLNQPDDGSVGTSFVKRFAPSLGIDFEPGGLFGDRFYAGALTSMVGRFDGYFQLHITHGGTWRNGPKNTRRLVSQGGSVAFGIYRADENSISFFSPDHGGARFLDTLTFTGFFGKFMRSYYPQFIQQPWGIIAAKPQNILKGK